MDCDLAVVIGERVGVELLTDRGTIIAPELLAEVMHVRTVEAGTYQVGARLIEGVEGQIAARRLVDRLLGRE